MKIVKTNQYMEYLNNQKDDSPNDDEDDFDKENEKATLKKKKKNDHNIYKKKKKIKINDDCQATQFYIIISILLIFLFIYLVLQILAHNSYSTKNKHKETNLRKIEKQNRDNTKKIKKKKKSNELKVKTTENINTIDDVKNLDIPLIYETKNIKSDEEIMATEKPKNKIKIAFLYYSIQANGIGRFIAVTSNNLIKTGKYDIYFITEKPPSNSEFAYDPRIKRYIAYNNYSLIQNITTNENINIVVLQNVLSTQVFEFYKKLRIKVICMFHGVFLSAIVHNILQHFKYWNQFDSCDSFIFITADDYYIYKNLGFKNAIYIPNLYTFDPSEIKNSNLTNKNIVILGRLNDSIKGIVYAIESMYYIIKEVPDATLYLYSSDQRIQFLKDLTQNLNLTKNVIFKPSTKNISEVFWNSSVHMFTSLSEAFPMAMNEGKAHGLPIVGFEVPYSPPYQQGFIGVELFDVKGLARETVKLLKDYNYRKEMGQIAKKSLDVFKNSETVELWGKLCDSLMSKDREDYRKFQREIENKYYNEKKAREHLESQFNIFLKRNVNLSCYRFDDFLDVNYLKNIKPCNITNIRNNTKNLPK